MTDLSKERIRTENLVSDTLTECLNRTEENLKKGGYCETYCELHILCKDE